MFFLKPKAERTKQSKENQAKMWKNLAFFTAILGSLKIAGYAFQQNE